MDEHKTPGRISIYFSKAFDTLSRDVFLHKLKVYDVSGVEHKMLISYLSDRKQYVLVSSKTISNYTDLYGRLELCRVQFLDHYYFVLT